ncbi:MAG: hypothetical protein ACRDKB_02555 [Actinomycetota bacterium]
MEDDKEVRNSVSRRGVLKRAGVGAAIVWSAPVLTSLASPAYAQGGTPPSGPGPSDCTIGRDWTCGQVIEECTGDPANPPPCVCDVDTEGRTFCWNNYFCADTSVCSSSDDCPGDARCVSSCCSSSTTFTCAPPCGQTLPGASSSSSGAKAAG